MTDQYGRDNDDFDIEHDDFQRPRDDYEPGRDDYDERRDPYELAMEQQDAEFRRSIERRDSGGIDLTSNWVRIAATVLVILFGVAIIMWALRPDPEESAVVTEPTAEPTTDAEVAVVPTFTAGPTITPPPEEGATDEGEGTETEGEGTDEGEPDDNPAISTGDNVVVTGTDGLGVNLRESANTSAAIIQILNDDTPLTVVGGPEDAEGFTWWRVALEDGVEGWLVEDYLGSSGP